MEPLTLRAKSYPSICQDQARIDHWMGVKRVLRYLKVTLKYDLKFSAHEEEPELVGYSDADWGRSSLTLKI